MGDEANKETWLNDLANIKLTNQDGIWEPWYGFANHPMVEVTWYGAQAYCDWTGRRLPTDAEWEKAARGGLERKYYPWGNDYPVCDKGAWNGAQTQECGQLITTYVKSFAPNGYDLYDMGGNVWEWVSDWYQKDYYGNSYVMNPQGPSSGTYRTQRGGSFGEYEYYVRVAGRNYHVPDDSGPHFGFRCADSP